MVSCPLTCGDQHQRQEKVIFFSHAKLCCISFHADKINLEFVMSNSLIFVNKQNELLTWTYFYRLMMDKNNQEFCLKFVCAQIENHRTAYALLK